MEKDKREGMLEELKDCLEPLKDINKEIQGNIIYDSVVGGEANKLLEIEKQLSQFKTKLEKGIMEIGFVGLEKAGKSSLVNAIVGEDVLPAKRERATYTTTRLEYGEEGKVIIEFYKEDEFIEMFRGMLEEVKYPEANRQTLRSVSLKDFKDHFEKLKDQDRTTYEKHSSKLEKDIEEIIEGKDKIENHLNSPMKEFPYSGKEQYEDYITHRHISRAVKSITIKSPALKDIKNVIIYDLPGFDSPTRKHLEFTIEKLKEADAIVFVKEAKSPSIRGPELEVFIQQREEDGSALKDKLFLFSNQADLLRDQADYEYVKSKLIEDLNRNNINIERNRVIYGSALARMQTKGRVSEDGIIEKLEKIGITDGIDELLEAIKSYYNNERMNVLQKRIHSRMEQAKTILDQIKKKIDKNFDLNNLLLKDAIPRYDKFKKDVKRYLRNKLIDYQREAKNIQKERRFSNKVIQNIQSLFDSDKLLSDKLKEETKREVESKTSTFEPRPDDYSKQLREKLSSEVLKTVKSIVIGSVKEEYSDEQRKIYNIFKDALKIKDNTEEDFIKALNEFLKDIGVELDYTLKTFDGIVERFAGDIIQLLIYNDLNSQDRKNKFKEIERELYSLLAFHEKTDLSNLKESVENIIDEIMYQTSYDKILANVTEIAKNKGIDEDDINAIKDKMSRYKDVVSKSSERFLQEFASANITNINQIPNMLDKIGKELNNIKNRTYDDVEEEIKTDISNLKDLLSQCVINAMGVEKFIVNILTSSINILIDILEDKDEEKSEIFDGFIYKVLINFSKEDISSNFIKEYTYASELEKFVKLVEKIKC